MMIIRNAQVHVFREERVQSFEKRMIETLRRAFPSDFESVDTVSMRREVQDTIKDALDHGITAEFDIARFVFLRHLLGEGFETAPQRPWAAQTLQDSSLSGSAKIDILSVHAKDELGPKFVDWAKL